MSNPLTYLIRMVLFLVAVAGLAYVLHTDLIRVFTNTPMLDSVILGVLALGIFFVFRQVIILWPEVNWLRRYQHREANAPLPKADSVNLLSPLAAMLDESPDQFRLSPTATRALLDGIAARLDERRELSRYLIGLLIFLGLLGTFWGLLQTIGAVADAINGLQVSAGDAVQMFGKLKGSIEGPLKGMSTAFGASLFGLSGSLVLGFLELQASQAQGRFHIELEEWLARATSLSRAGMPAAPNVPAYVEALLERNAESVDELNRHLQRVEDNRKTTATANATLVERLAALAETMRAQQNLLARFTELSIELRGALQVISSRSATNDADRDASFAHQGRIETHLDRLIEETIRGRATLTHALRDLAGKDGNTDAVLAAQRELGNKLEQKIDSAVSKLSDRSAAEADREILSDLRRTVDNQLARLAEENTRNRAALAEEIRGAVTRLGDRFADIDRDAITTHQRNIEAHLARLVEDGALNRAKLADELRGEMRLLARTIALSRGYEAPAGSVPSPASAAED